MRLTDDRSGREWLIPTSPTASPPAPGTAWKDWDVAGWDECFPNISPDDHGLEDHGQLWSRPWDAELVQGGVRCAVEIGPWTFARTLTGTRDRLTAEYEVTANEDHLSAAWSMHPLLALEAGARILLPAPTGCRVEHQFGNSLQQHLPQIARGRVGATTTVPPADAAFAVKLYLDLSPGVLGAIGTDEAWLLMFWNPSDVPGCGLWINAGGWPSPPDGPAAHVAFEPCIGDSDDLSIVRARASGLTAGLRSAVKRWKINWRAGHGAADLDAALLLPVRNGHSNASNVDDQPLV